MTGHGKRTSHHRSLNTERQTTGEREGELQRIVSEAATVVGMPAAILSIIDQGRRWIAGNLGAELIDKVELDTFLSQLILKPGEPLIVLDTSLEKRYSGFKNVIGEIRFLAGFPIVDRGGYMLGSLYVAGFDPLQEGCLPDKTLSRVALTGLVTRCSVPASDGSG
jgi:GAF domain-containing protein